eukprot:maker-scaffold400_size182785-snap-gene-0.23 protein:Tk02295 transcript:maker-scaffold400_size182785-snap-gene-0.23-mRNA-1 annotation:"liver carboxylesterase"
MNPKRSVLLLFLGALSLVCAQDETITTEASQPEPQPRRTLPIQEESAQEPPGPRNVRMEKHIIEIETPLGPVQGMLRSTESGNNIYAFMGLPYAEPPVREYRFTDPFAKIPWINPINATAVKPLCIQTNSISFESDGDEDCLYLNVYSPKLPHAGSNARDGLLLPIVVFIHGMEHFTTDTSSQWNPELLVEEDVVVITMSYRLGVFGFLNINHPLLSGNQGLKDQLEALRWIRQNIHVFGGDGKRLTLMGHGAGAISVDLHRYSYQTRDQGLFHSLVMQSGSALSLHHPMMKKSTVSNSLRFAEEIGCNQTNANDIVECLQAKPAEELLEMSKLEQDPLVALEKDQNGTHFLFLPSLDPLSEFPYMTELPFASLMQGDYEDLPNIRGMTQDEGGYIDTIEIETPSGPVMGKIAETEGESKKKYYQFLGIPYAEAPVDGLRFKGPEPKKAWKDALNVTAFKAVCPQTDADQTVIGEEDCLFLNVFTPRIPAQDSTRGTRKSSLLPVMVFIHGGNFIMGSGNMIPEPLVIKDVIVVTLNYRLGVLGFLNLGHPSASGNQGLKDQVEAFKWVQHHIIAFGGDPTKITIFGQDSGATSVQIHMLSPQGHGLYQGAIVQSGNLLYLTHQLRRGVVQGDSARLAKHLECTEDNPSEMLQCLQEKNIADLGLNMTGMAKNITADLEQTFLNNGTFTFGPSLETASPNPILPQHPLDLLGSRHNKDIPTIVGFVKNEGSLFLAQHIDSLSAINGNWSYFGPKVVFGADYRDINEAMVLKANVTRHFYLGTKNITEETTQELVDLFSDAEYYAPGIQMLREQAQGRRSPMFLYEIDHQPTKTYAQEVLGMEAKAPINHGNDIFYLFTEVAGVKEAISSEEDKKVAEAVVTLWTNFAKHQDPTPYQNEDLPIWDAYDPEMEKYLSIGNMSTIEVGFNSERMYFWDKIVWGDILEGAYNSQPPMPIPGAPLQLPNLPMDSRPYQSLLPAQVGLGQATLPQPNHQVNPPQKLNAQFQGQPGV